MRATRLEKYFGLIQEGGAVKRYHAKNTIQQETVGLHSYQVAWLIDYLMEDSPRKAIVLMAGLQHDITEAVTGDMPGPTKAALNSKGDFSRLENKTLEDFGHRNYVEELLIEELRVLSLADYAAGLLFCIQERNMGNKFMVECYDNYMKVIDRLLNIRCSAKEADLVQFLTRKWKEANV